MNRLENADEVTANATAKPAKRAAALAVLAAPPQPDVGPVNAAKVPPGEAVQPKSSPDGAAKKKLAPRTWLKIGIACQRPGDLAAADHSGFAGHGAGAACCSRPGPDGAAGTTAD